MPNSRIRMAALSLALLLLGGSVLAQEGDSEPGAWPINGLGEGHPVCEFLPTLNYPPAIADRSLAGLVLVRAYIDETGRVYDTEVLNSDLPELFIVEALKTARLGRFRPARKKGRPQRGSLVLPLRFLPLAAPADPSPALARPSPEDIAPERNAVAAAPVVDTPLETPLETPVEVREDPPPATVQPTADSADASEDEAPARTEARPASAVRVVDAAFGREVTARRLDARDTVFAVGDRVYFWMEVAGCQPGEVLSHVWIYRGRAVQEIDLTMKDERWISWSYKTLFAGLTGSWLVELRDAEDRLLGSWTFHCE